MESSVHPCPSAFVLRTMVDEGFHRFAESVKARELHHAATMDSMAIVQRLLEASSRDEWVWSCDEVGNTALHVAARSGNVHVVGVLLQSQAELDARNLRGEVPLHIACDAGHTEIVELLCAVDADPRLGDLASDEVPGFLAVRRHAERSGCFDAICSEGADKATTGRPRIEHRQRSFVCIEACLEAVQRFDSTMPAAASLVNSSGRTGLHVAAEASDLAVCKLLLAFHASANATEIVEGTTPLMSALLGVASLDIIKLLLKAAADPCRKDGCDGVPLHYAVACGDDAVPAVVLLVRARADLDAVDERGVCALAVAGMRGASGVMRCLLSAGASPQRCRSALPLMAETPGPDERNCREILEAVM